MKFALVFSMLLTTFSHAGAINLPSFTIRGDHGDALFKFLDSHGEFTVSDPRKGYYALKREVEKVTNAFGQTTQKVTLTFGYQVVESPDDIIVQCAAFGEEDQEGRKFLESLVGAYCVFPSAPWTFVNNTGIHIYQVMATVLFNAFKDADLSKIPYEKFPYSVEVDGLIRLTCEKPFVTIGREMKQLDECTSARFSILSH